MVIRVRKQDSAYLYQILESYEGLVSFSTLPAPKEDPYREIALHVPPGATDEVKNLVNRLRAEIELDWR